MERPLHVDNVAVVVVAVGVASAGERPLAGVMAGEMRRLCHVATLMMCGRMTCMTHAKVRLGGGGHPSELAADHSSKNKATHCE